MIVKEIFNEAKLRYIFDNYYKLFPNESLIKEESVSKFIKKNNENKKEEFDWNTFQYNSIKKILDSSKDGVFEANYIQKNGQGRHYPEGFIGLCCLSRTIRHTITCDYSVDIDIKNSSPSILYNLLEKENEKLENNKFKYQNLENYILNRDEFLKDLCEKKNIEKKDAKSLVVAIINNKFIHGDELETYPTNFINFYWEMYHIRNKLAEIYVDFYNEIKKEKNEKSGINLENKNNENKDTKKINYMGSFMTKLLFNYENEIIMNCVKIFNDKKIAVHGLQFDGFPFDKNKKKNDLLQICSDEVLKKMGFKISFDFKELDEIIEIPEDLLEPYQFDVVYKKFINNNSKKRQIEEIVQKIPDDMLLYQFDLIIKACFNIILDKDGTIIFIKKWMKKSLEKHFLNEEELNKMIENYKNDATNQEKKLNLASIIKVSKEIEKQFKEKEIENKKKSILNDNLKKTQDNSYEKLKEEFELNNMIIGGNIVYEKNGRLDYYNFSQAKIKNMNISYYEYDEINEKVIKKKFFEQWLNDPNRRQYNNIDFIPDISLCPRETFNLFKGFNAEKYNPNYEMTEKEILEKINPIINHLNILTSGHGIYLLKWMAFIIQNPWKKTQIAPLIRDQGEIFSEGGGTGKNIFFEYFGNKILGKQYFHVIADNKELYNSFNSQFEGKLFILVEETNSKDNHSNQDPLKSTITKNTLNVNRKNIAQYTVQDYSNYIFCSNNKNPLPIRLGNRRHAVFDTDPIKRGDNKYFNDLYNHLEDDLTAWAFYKYLLGMETFKNPIEFSNNIPETKAYLEIRTLNAPIHLKWILSLVREKKLENMGMGELYKKFCEWIKVNHESKDEQVMSLTAFGLLLNNDKVNNQNDENNNAEINNYSVDNIGIKKINNGRIVMNWNVKSVVDGLKKIYLLEKDFVY